MSAAPRYKHLLTDRECHTATVAFDHAVARAKERVVLGRPIGSSQAIHATPRKRDSA